MRGNDRLKMTIENVGRMSKEAVAFLCLLFGLMAILADSACTSWLTRSRVWLFSAVLRPAGEMKVVRLAQTDICQEPFLPDAGIFGDNFSFDSLL